MVTLPLGRMGSWLMMLALVTEAVVPNALAQTRSVRGVVTDQLGGPLKGAVVKVKNTLNLHIRTYITQTNGEYQFHGLHPDIDYQLWVRYRGQNGKAMTLHWYDSRREARIDLKIRVTEDARTETGGRAKELRITKGEPK